jgi:5-methylcytosine-specific restriction endonuclease McrA
VKRCLEPQCFELTNGSRCPRHERAMRQRRGGSGWQEQRDRRATIQRDGLHCAECGILTTDTPGYRNSAEQDHRMAIANGGDSRASNRRILCRSCNRAKGARP